MFIIGEQDGYYPETILIFVDIFGRGGLTNKIEGV